MSNIDQAALLRSHTWYRERFYALHELRFHINELLEQCEAHNRWADLSADNPKAAFDKVRKEYE